MKRPIKTILAVLAIGLASSGPLARQAQGAHFGGEINFGGTVNFFGGISAGNATGVNGWYGLGGAGTPFVTDASGDFASFVSAGHAATFTAPWSFTSGAVSNFWSFWSVDGFTFNLSSSSIQSQIAPTLFSNKGKPLNGSILVTGLGFVSGNGFGSTPVEFTFSTQDALLGGLATFTFHDPPSGPAAVPEGGSTVALLGLALAGVEGVRRRLVGRK